MSDFSHAHQAFHKKSGKSWFWIGTQTLDPLLRICNLRHSDVKIHIKALGEKHSITAHTAKELRSAEPMYYLRRNDVPGNIVSWK